MNFTVLALIGDIGGPELLLIFVLVLVLFGGQRLPEFARGLGKSIREFKKATSGVEEEIKRALEEPPPQPKRPVPLIAPPVAVTAPALVPIEPPAATIAPPSTNFSTTPVPTLGELKAGPKPTEEPPAA